MKSSFVGFPFETAALTSFLQSQAFEYIVGNLGQKAVGL